MQFVSHLSPLWKNHSAGVDWLTVSEATDTWQGKELLAFGQDMLDWSLRQGYECDKAKVMQYEGFSVGKCFLGQSDSHVLFRSSGSDSHYVALELAERMPYANITRIDIETTARASVEINDWETRLHYKRQYQAKEGNPQPLEVCGLLQSRNRGTIFAAGSRASTRYLRIYNKTLEQCGAIDPNCHRAEVEYKKGMANVTFQRLVQSGSKAETCRGIVKAECERFGIDGDWLGTGETVRLPCYKREHPDEATLNWLQKIAMQSARKMAGKGHGDALRKMGFNV